MCDGTATGPSTVPSCVRRPGNTRTTGGSSSALCRRGCCWPRAGRWTSWRCPRAVGRLVCAQLRAAGMAVPVAATPTGRWWFPVTTGGALPDPCASVTDVVLHTGGAAVLAPPSETPDGWVHWRVAPALSGYRPSPVGPIVAAVVAAVDGVRRRPPPRAAARM